MTTSVFLCNSDAPQLELETVAPCNWIIENGDAGYRSLYLSHAERALYHLSYTPVCLIPCSRQNNPHESIIFCSDGHLHILSWRVHSRMPSPLCRHHARQVLSLSCIQLLPTQLLQAGDAQANTAKSWLSRESNPGPLRCRQRGGRGCPNQLDHGLLTTYYQSNVRRRRDAC